MDAEQGEGSAWNLGSKYNFVFRRGNVMAEMTSGKSSMRTCAYPTYQWRRQRIYDEAATPPDVAANEFNTLAALVGVYLPKFPSTACTRRRPSHSKIDH